MDYSILGKKVEEEFGRFLSSYTDVELSASDIRYLRQEIFWYVNRRDEMTDEFYHRLMNLDEDYQIRLMRFAEDVRDGIHKKQPCTMIFIPALS